MRVDRFDERGVDELERWGAHVAGVERTGEVEWGGVAEADALPSEFGGERGFPFGRPAGGALLQQLCDVGWEVLSAHRGRAG